MRKKRDLKAKMLTSLLTALSVLFSIQCKKDNFDKLPEDGSQLGVIPFGTKLAALSADGITSGSYYLVNSLPSGYVKDGSRDYTSYVQAVLNKYSNIVFPGFPILVNDIGINIGSNKTITFQEGSEIRLKGTSNDFYNILKISGASNVTLYNPVIVGDRNSHIGTSGEHGMGIGIRGSNNVTIYSPKITNCWGDGIYIGQLNNSINNQNIVIKDAYLSKNRRDGLTIISVDGLLVDNIYAGYTDGTKPWCGINIEPNNTNCVLKNIRINNPRTENNGSRGIQIVNKNMLGSTDKTTDITIVNHVDIGSPDNAFKFNCNPTTDITGKMYGQINLVNPNWIKTLNNVPLNLSTNQSNYKTTISSPEVMNTSGTVLSWSQTYSLLMLQASRAPLTVNNETVSTSTTSTTTSSTTTPVFAVNAGGSSFTASNGITYSADKNYSGGTTYKESLAVSNTSDDVLYQSERKGNFSYAIPLSNGTYEVTFKVAEMYFKAAGQRQFDILAENITVVSNLDIYSVSGYGKAYDVVKTVSVTDGTLNLIFRADINNAKISAFHIIKK